MYGVLWYYNDAYNLYARVFREDTPIVISSEKTEKVKFFILYVWLALIRIKKVIIFPQWNLYVSVEQIKKKKTKQI